MGFRTRPREPRISVVFGLALALTLERLRLRAAIGRRQRAAGSGDREAAGIAVGSIRDRQRYASSSGSYSA
ncbi:hypothetical protein CP556_10010 [Natrinema sp. CBA1119]|uniref:hypothetical protein n=1 Tax=Natrinema sp. CBA1119 TaxID=1608465 RepID=UPI000BF3E486|nr:hypothetical protein [Natrinema sp. CBA1119]PGF16418.1 hypothetical protein CP556_10010 [Natrinema sp. CBA1119]